MSAQESSTSRKKSATAPLIQVFEPHKAKTPPLIPYFTEFWNRRSFALELARFADKAEYLESKLGKAWLILNPLFLSLVYFLLVTVLRGGANSKTGLSTLAHILIGIFMFYFAQNIISDGASRLPRTDDSYSIRHFLERSSPSPHRFVLSDNFGQPFLPTLPSFSSARSSTQRLIFHLPIGTTSGRH